MLGQAAQGGCGVSISGDIQSRRLPAWPSPVLCTKWVQAVLWEDLKSCPGRNRQDWTWRKLLCACFVPAQVFLLALRRKVLSELVVVRLSEPFGV